MRAIPRKKIAAQHNMQNIKAGKHPLILPHFAWRNTLTHPDD